MYDVWNNHAAVFVQIEDVEGVENVEAILQVEGVDGVMVGATDLRFSMGLEAGSADGDEGVFVGGLKKVQAAADGKGVPVLGFAVTEEVVRKRVRLGWRALVVHADAAGIFNSGVRGLERCVSVASEVQGGGVSGGQGGGEKYKLYGYEQNPRTRVARIVARAIGVEVELVEVVPRDEVGVKEYEELFPLSQGKIPGLAGPGSEGVRLTETIAIATFLAGLGQGNQSHLMGDGSERQRAEVLSWMSWANSELLPALGRWFLPLIQFKERPVVVAEEEVRKGREAAERLLDGLERNLEQRAGEGGGRYLVGRGMTVADVMVAVFVGRGLQWVLDEGWRERHGRVMKFFGMVAEWQPVRSTIPEFVMVERVGVNGELRK